MSLRARIFLSMLAILVLSSVMLVIAAGVYFKRENDRYHQERLKRKEEAIKLSINYILTPSESSLPSDSVVNVFDSKICELADINKLDINIYSLNGNLLISSYPEMFPFYGLEETLTENILNKLSDGEVRLLQEHKNDSIHFLLSYSYLYSNDGKKLGIINIPYAQTDDTPKQELMIFISTLGKVYLILLLGAGLLAYFVSNYITKSLIEVKERIKSFNLSKTNEKLNWEHNDEIGSLIREYNRMIDELQASADLLAKSEREGAWRQMARQVAHEIKNPLTPMKLSVQMLERQLKPEQENFKERMSQFTKAMIEQIDTLSNIASSFSNFAHMPKGNYEPLDLRSVARTAWELYDKSQVKLILPEEEVRINSDREQLLRVLNNLINNALQAIPDDRTPEVVIELNKEEHFACLHVRDNGVGISKESLEVIFEPSFTTKSSGTGLGLAMVHNIMNMNKGKIEVQSNLGEGSEFKLCFPYHL